MSSNKLNRRKVDMVTFKFAQIYSVIDDEVQHGNILSIMYLISFDNYCGCIVTPVWPVKIFQIGCVVFTLFYAKYKRKIIKGQSLCLKCTQERKSLP